MAITATSFGTSTSTLTPTITFGTTLSAGDLMVMAIGTDAAHTGLVATSPWVEFGAELTPTNARGGTFYLIASGGETQCTDIDATGTADRWEVVMWRIPAGEWHGTTPPERNTQVTGSSTSPDSGSMAPSWGSETGNIFGTVCVRDDSVANTITAYPTGYDTAQIDKNDITSCGNVGGAIKIATAASDDAGAFTISASETWAAVGFAVRPAGASGTTLSPTAATVTLTGQTTGLIFGTVLQPTQGTVTLTGQAPAVIVGTVLQPAAAAVALTGQAPAVVIGTVLQPAHGTVTLTGFAPDVQVGGGLTLSPAAATVVLSGSAPVVTATAHQVLSPTPAQLAMTAFAPNVIATDHVIAQPHSAAVVFTGFAPEVEVSGGEPTSTFPIGTRRGVPVTVSFG